MGSTGVLSLVRRGATEKDEINFNKVEIMLESRGGRDKKGAILSLKTRNYAFMQFK